MSSNTSVITLCAIQAGDIDVLRQLVAQVSAHDILPQFTPQGREAYRQQVIKPLATILDKSRFIGIKAQCNQQLVAFVALRDNNYLSHLFVAKDFQGFGIGRQLLNAVLQHAPESVNLRSSLNAVSFYQRAGFVISGEEDSLNGIRFVPMCLEAHSLR